MITTKAGHSATSTWQPWVEVHVSPLVHLLILQHQHMKQLTLHTQPLLRAEVHLLQPRQLKQLKQLKQPAEAAEAAEGSS